MADMGEASKLSEKRRIAEMDRGTLTQHADTSLDGNSARRE
jgi:hypothetical protein